MTRSGSSVACSFFKIDQRTLPRRRLRRSTRRAPPCHFWPRPRTSSRSNGAGSWT